MMTILYSGGKTDWWFYRYLIYRKISINIILCVKFKKDSIGILLLIIGQSMAATREVEAPYYIENLVERHLGLIHPPIHLFVYQLIYLLSVLVKSIGLFRRDAGRCLSKKPSILNNS